MRKRIFLFSIFLCCFLIGQPVFAQMDIRIKLTGITCDSVRIQSFNWKKKSGTNLVRPYQNEVQFKEKSSLKPGVYWITTDTTHRGVVLLPFNKQQISITLCDTGLVFSKNSENTQYQEYNRMMRLYDQQLAALDNEFRDAQKLPQYMLRSIVDSLTVRAQRINAAREQYTRDLLSKYPNTLLASIVQLSRPLPELPQALYGNPPLIQAFVMEHYFDNFPWNDPRIFNSPMAEDKLSYYCRELVYQWDRPELDTFVVKALEKAQINPESHLLFFDRLERDLGFYMSDYKVEHTYIKMLQHILRTRPDLEPVRKTFYEHELKTINKNVDGTQAANFRYLTPQGDTTTLYETQSEYMLLFLHNPSCSTCREVRRRMKQFAVLDAAITGGRLKVLTIYLENDRAIWKHYLQSEAAANYLHGWNFDQSIENQDLYETRTIPYMYLLDKDKRVIRKNILVNEIEYYIRKLELAK